MTLLRNQVSEVRLNELTLVVGAILFESVDNLGCLLQGSYGKRLGFNSIRKYSKRYGELIS